MNQLQNIISVRDVCAGEQVESLSGLDLMDAPEISAKNLANIANEEYVSGLNLAKKKVVQALILVRNDLMSVMAANKVIPDLSVKQYTTGEFKTNITYPEETKERGVVLYKNSKIRGKLRKLVIHNVQVYALANAEGVELKIYDDHSGGIVSTYNIDLEANKVNTFNIEYELKGTFARVLLDGTNVSVCSSYLTCFTGCNGRMPNDCGYTKGWYDTKEITSKEGFGINLEFSCGCEYGQLLCDMAQTYVGEIVWLKSRVLLLEEHLRTNRLNNWVVYGREETKNYLADLEDQYRDKWQTFIGAMPGILKQFNDDCLLCNGIRWVTNV
ncbi:MAG: hypothetical protein H6550_13645 [Chitinophagales bacterium]|nr:hypothetical protein [Chitinophagales bacterium]